MGLAALAKSEKRAEEVLRQAAAAFEKAPKPGLICPFPWPTDRQAKKIGHHRSPTPDYACDRRRVSKYGTRLWQGHEDHLRY
jgi:hypothetical protein